jgi:ubiquinone/menaquinone biosynthesis C-methylase UbiE
MALSGILDMDPMVVIRDRYMAPGVIAPFADDIARRLSRISMGPLLETCADTGILTQAMGSALSAGLTIVATDPDQGTVNHASIKPGMARITWQRADPCDLPFPDGTFGIVVCHFGVVGIANRVLAFQQARRVMKQGARFVFSVPAQLRHNPVAECQQHAMDELFPTDPPSYLRSVLHGYADNETIDDDLTAAGFTDAIYTTVELPYVAASAWDVATGYCLGTPLRAEIEARAPGDAERIIRAASTALQARFGNGSIETTMRAHIVSASG